MKYLCLTLATRNTRDFEDCDIQFFNPFERKGSSLHQAIYVLASEDFFEYHRIK
jgi:hypothetical protein